MAAESCIPVIPSKDLEKSLRLNGGEHFISLRDLPQACLQLLESDGGVPVFRRTVEFYC
jgi:hypothetical protein